MRRLLPLLGLALPLLALGSSASGGNPGTGPGLSAPLAKGTPSISGAPVVGSTLSTSGGTWSGPSATYSYQWLRCNTSGASCAPIQGASKASYLLTTTDIGTELRVAVTASNKNGSSLATSDATAVVTAISSGGSTTTTTTSPSTSTTTTSTPTTTTAPTTTTTTSTTPTTTTAPVSSPYVSDSFDQGVQNYWQSTPDRTANAGLFVGEPSAVGLLTTATSYTPNTGQMTALWLPAAQAYSGWDAKQGKAVDGVDTWYRQQFRLPSSAYKPTPGEWNWLVVWHDDAHTSSYGACCSTAIGIFNDAYLQNGLVMRLAGGNSATPTYDYSCKLPPNSLLYDHTYDLVEHFYWSTTAGKAEWWVDGQLVCSKSFPTLFKNPDGTVSYNTFGIYNYHAAYQGDMRVDFDSVAIGPTRNSVAP